MDEKTQKIVIEQIKQLPSNVREAIISVDYKTKLQEITKRQRLLIDQAAKLEMETTLVMIGLEPLADYTENLQRELAVPIVRAKEIAMDVSENIFKSIRESLQTMNEKTEIEKEQISTDNSFATKEEILPRFTNSSEPSLNRDQILSEIENPATINGGARTMDFTSAPVPTKTEQTKTTPTTEIEIRPTQEILLRPNTPEKPQKQPDILESKMTVPTITPTQTVNIKPEIKLPEVEKKRPSSGIDPYREVIM